MPEMTLEQAMDFALKQQQGGNLALAESIYRKILERVPEHSDAMHLLGLIANETHRRQEAEGLIRRSIEIRPDRGIYWANLGLVLMNLGREAEAKEACGRALALDPRAVIALNVMGSMHQNNKDFGAAAEYYRRSLEAWPSSLETAENLAICLQELHQYREAMEIHERVAKAWGDSEIIQNNLGCVSMALREYEKAVGYFTRSLAINPRQAKVYDNMGVAYNLLRKFDEAEACFRKSCELEPRSAELHNHMANLLKDMGMLEGAKTEFLKAMELDAGRADIFSSFLLTLLYDSNTTLEEEKAWRAKWNERYAEGLCKTPAAMPQKQPERLRVGFVSADLKGHPVGRFMKPLLENLDRSRFFIACYSDAVSQSPINRELRNLSDLWVDTITLSNEQLDQRIRADGIDILIDLSAHSAGNRLLVFARKPAPVQITWLGYCGSTGLSAMDFRISDSRMDPPGMFEGFHSEKTLLLPRTYWCYPTPPSQEPPSQLPWARTGRVTFGCLNNFCKISPLAVECWVEILKKVEGSRLKLYAGEGSCRARFLKSFEEAGVDSSRVDFISFVPHHDYFGAYREIDIALDPFPFNGGMTSCDAIWMGVPFVTLASDRPVGRAGLSILSNVGLSEWAANDPMDYIQKAVALASDFGRLGELRGTLRDRMLASPLMDAGGFARDFADLLDRAWELKAGSDV